MSIVADIAQSLAHPTWLGTSGLQHHSHEPKQCCVQESPEEVPRL